MKKKEAFSKLPSVDSVLSNSRIEDLLKDYPRELVLESIREVINLKRKEIVSMDENEMVSFDIKEEDLITNIINSTKNKFELSIKKVVNGTGIVIHTNLGRSRLSPKIQEEIINIGFGYSNLEYDLSKGKRGSRDRKSVV